MSTEWTLKTVKNDSDFNDEIDPTVNQIKYRNEQHLGINIIRIEILIVTIKQ